MYYWVLFDISFMRILTYHTFSTYCEKLQRRIVKPSLAKYEEKDLYKKIEAQSESKDSKKQRLLFKDVNKVRGENMQRII